MSEALDTVHDERANGRMSPALDDYLHEVETRLAALEDASAPAAVKANTPNGGE